jgi:hypothetical protein
VLIQPSCFFNRAALTLGSSCNSPSDKPAKRKQSAVFAFIVEGLPGYPLLSSGISYCQPSKTSIADKRTKTRLALLSHSEETTPTLKEACLAEPGLKRIEIFRQVREKQYYCRQEQA